MRPNDIQGNPIVMGPWYWARNRRGQVVGTGKFADTIGSDNITFFIGGQGYEPGGFEFERVTHEPFALLPEGAKVETEPDYQHVTPESVGTRQVKYTKGEPLKPRQFVEPEPAATLDRQRVIEAIRREWFPLNQYRQHGELSEVGAARIETIEELMSRLGIDAAWEFDNGVQWEELNNRRICPVEPKPAVKGANP